MKVLFSSAVLDKHSGAEREMEKDKKKNIEKDRVRDKEKKIVIFQHSLGRVQWGDERDNCTQLNFLSGRSGSRAVQKNKTELALHQFNKYIYNIQKNAMNITSKKFMQDHEQTGCSSGT